MIKLTVVIVNYNVKHFLQQCLHSVVRATTNIKSEIFVVDNNSTDNSVEILQRIFHRLRLLPIRKISVLPKQITKLSD